MANTTNFGWETPDDTDLVKDGALAMRTLGNAIDTSLVDLKGGTTGQVLSKNTNTDMDFTWVTPNDADAIQNSIVDAKGDLITATADNTPARLASSGVNGDVLTVDTTTSTGLKWAAISTGATWTTWTPTIVGLTLGNGTANYRYATVGKVTYYLVTLKFGSTSSFTGNFRFSPPTTPRQSTVLRYNVGTAFARDVSVNTSYWGMAEYFVTDNRIFPFILKTDTTYASASNLDSTVPFTWATDDEFSVYGWYEEA